jgi:hypothetical protein
MDHIKVVVIVGKAKIDVVNLKSTVTGDVIEVYGGWGEIYSNDLAMRKFTRHFYSPISSIRFVTKCSKELFTRYHSHSLRFNRQHALREDGLGTGLTEV